MTKQKLSPSWSVSQWPEEIYPGEPGKARYLVRAHRDELLQAGALVRVGRELVILGDRYQAWLARKAAAVPGFECAANRSREAAA